MIGFVNGLAIVIFLSQIENFTTVGFHYTHTCGSSQCLNICHDVFLRFSILGCYCTRSAQKFSSFNGNTALLAANIYMSCNIYIVSSKCA